MLILHFVPKERPGESPAIKCPLIIKKLYLKIKL